MLAFDLVRRVVLLPPVAVPLVDSEDDAFRRPPWVEAEVLPAAALPDVETPAPILVVADCAKAIAALPLMKVAASAASWNCFNVIIILPSFSLAEIVRQRPVRAAQGER